MILIHLFSPTVLPQLSPEALQRHHHPPECGDVTLVEEVPNAVWRDPFCNRSGHQHGEYPTVIVGTLLWAHHVDHVPVLHIWSVIEFAISDVFHTLL